MRDTVPSRAFATQIAPAEPYKGELAAVDALRPDDVMIVSAHEWPYWGELLSTSARYRGCRPVDVAVGRLSRLWCGGLCDPGWL